MLLFICLFAVSIILLIGSGVIGKDNKIAKISSRVMGGILLIISVFLIYGVFSDQISFPLN